MASEARKRTGKYTGVCVKCQVRRRRKASGCCEPCEALRLAEGTGNDVALASQNELAAQRRKELVKRYNALARKGLSAAEIAAAMGWKTGTLSGYMHKAKSAYGLDVVNLRQAQSRLGRKPVIVREKRNTHGGGKYGVSGCECDPCMKVRRDTRRVADAARYQAKKKAAEQNKPS